MATARIAWGIDVGNRALKAVKLVREGAGVRIDDYEVVEHEHVLSNAGDNRESLIQGALAQFVQNHGIKGVPVAVGVSGQSSFARFVKLPPVERKQIPNIVRFEAIQQIPFPLDDVEWSYQLFEDENSPDVEVGIFAMRKELVNHHIKYFTDAGLNVQVVQMNPLAVYNAMHFDQRLTGTTMIVDLGAENADLIITEGETIWLRSIPIGGNNFTEALAKQFKLRFEKAEELKRNAATSKYGRQILQAMRPIFADLVSEIQRSIGFYSSVHRDSRIARVVALGGTFKLPGLQKYLQQNLQLEVFKIDTLGNTPPTDAKVAALLSDNILSSPGAYGLALQALGDAKITSSLLPQAIRREKLWREKTKWFAAAAACFVAGTGLAVGRYYMDDAAYTKAESARSTIKTTLDTATRLSNEWKTLELKGTLDRKRIMEVKNSYALRDLWPQLYRDIQDSLPSAEADKKEKDRAKRVEIVLDDIQSQYMDDIGELVSAQTPDDQFNQHMAPREFFTPGEKSKRGAAAAAARNNQAAPVQVDPNAAANPGVSSGKRGYILTLHTTTANNNGFSHVANTLVKELQRRGQAPDPAAKASNGKLYQISRISIPRAIRLSDDPEWLKLLDQRKKEAAERKQKAGMGGAPSAGMGVGGAGAALGMPTTPVAPAVPGAGTGAVGTPPVPPPPPPGEDASNDWDVVVLVAVELVNPPAPPAEQPGQ